MAKTRRDCSTRTTWPALRDAASKPSTPDPAKRSRQRAPCISNWSQLKRVSHTLSVVGLSPGTVATDMQRTIKASGINPVSQLDWEDHIPPDWPADAVSLGSDDFGRYVQLEMDT